MPPKIRITSPFSSTMKALIPANSKLACVFAAMWAAAGPADIILSETTSDSGRLSVQSVLLWTSALHMVIFTARRPEISIRKAVVIYLLSTVSVIGGLLLIDTDFGGPSLLASLAAWVLLPTLVALFIPPVPNATLTLGDSAS